MSVPLDLGADDAPTTEAGGRLATGVEVIRAVLKTLPPSPGVYRMLNRQGDALYVGKARNLRNRVVNYTHPRNLPIRLQRMIAETARMEIVTTHTEVEALLLEINLIKRLMPRYNVLLRDDKSFPYIHLRSDHAVPQLTKHRGAQRQGGEYFGPFASAGAVNRTITALHRAFLLRSCSDSIFESRTRPCLQFQIKRCSAPCVDRIGREDYQALVGQARDFLTGRSSDINRRLVTEMTEAADRLDYEHAAQIRNRIRALSMIQADQNINVEGVADADVIAAYEEGGHTCIQAFFFRGGQNWGNRAYFPSHDRQIEAPEVLAAFLGQFYDDKPPPPLILLSADPAEAVLLAEALSEKSGRRVQLHRPQRGDKLKLVEHALANAREALARKLAETSSQRRLLRQLGTLFGMAAPPERIEVYDNSHIQGSNAVGAMIVAGPDGFDKGAYRKFNMKGAAEAPKQGGLAEAAVPYGYEPGDDYAMMREMLMRRFRRALEEDPDRSRGQWPDLVLIDGGAGQLATAESVLAELNLSDVNLVAIAKGPDRDAGRERLFQPGKPPVSLEPKDPALYFLQRLRDEAHRFAIGTHRARRQKAIGVSPLDEIGGIGPQRKRALLHQFGSARAVARAGLADLEQVPGINRAVAKKIYEHFHAAD
jgi:excinuclease ABC subunit C